MAENLILPHSLIEIIEDLKGYSNGTESIHFTMRFKGKERKYFKEISDFIIKNRNIKIEDIICKQIGFENEERYIFVHLYNKIKYITYGIRTDNDRFLSSVFAEYGLLIAEDEAIEREKKIKKIKKKKTLSKPIRIVRLKKNIDDLPF